MSGRSYDRVRNMEMDSAMDPDVEYERVSGVLIIFFLNIFFFQLRPLVDSPESATYFYSRPPTSLKPIIISSSSLYIPSGRISSDIISVHFFFRYFHSVVSITDIHFTLYLIYLFQDPGR